MLSSTFTLFAVTILGIICTSRSFPKMDFSQVIIRQRVTTKNTEVADLAKKFELLEKRLNETTQEMLHSNKDKLDLIETHISGVERKLEESQKEMEESQKELKECKVEMEDVKNRLTKFQGNVQGEAEHVKNEIQNLNISYTELDVKVDGFSEATAKIENNISALKQDNEVMLNKLSDVGEQTKKVKTDVILAVQSNQNLETRMTVFQGILDSVSGTGTVNTTLLQTRVEAVENKLDKIENKLESTNERTRCLQHMGFFYDTSTKLCMRLFYISPLDNPNAEKACRKYGSDGRLVIPDTQRKHSAIIAYIRSLGITSNVLVNGKRDSSGEFRWDDQRRIAGVLWCPGEPGDTRSKCMNLWSDQGFCFDDTWCDISSPYICEIPME